MRVQVLLDGCDAELVGLNVFVVLFIAEESVLVILARSFRIDLVKVRDHDVEDGGQGSDGISDRLGVKARVCRHPNARVFGRYLL